MTVVVIGNDASFTECKARLGDGHQYHQANTVMEGKNVLTTAAVVFDFSESHPSESLAIYSKLSKAVLFMNTVFTTVSAVLRDAKHENLMVGFCGLPTFFNREVLEVSIPDRSDKQKLDAIIQALGLNYIIVNDQVGFVTPRVVCMIINEAFDAWQSNVASQADIDLSMKLGTNYPFGPFEWSERIGKENVKKLLEAVYASTGDNRYRPVF
jgi:3-hydroxybutyryl-CoA dehydrogenase